MRIKIIGESNCARATRHLLRLGGFAVTEFLPADAVVGGPLAGYCITIELAPADLTPDSCLRPDSTTLQSKTSGYEEADLFNRDASSPSFAEATAGLPGKTSSMVAAIHFDSVDSALEAAVLRHVAQLAAAPVVVDRPGGVVHSDRELRIVAPNSGDAAADEAAAVAIEFGVLRGLLDLSAGARDAVLRNSGAEGTGGDGGSSASGRSASGRIGEKKIRGRSWWPFGIFILAGVLGVLRAGGAEGRGGFAGTSFDLAPVGLGSRVGLGSVLEGHRLKSVLLAGGSGAGFAGGAGFGFGGPQTEVCATCCAISGGGWGWGWGSLPRGGQIFCQH